MDAISRIQTEEEAPVEAPLEYVIKPMDTWWHLEHSVTLAGQVVPHATNVRDEMLHPDANYFVALYGPRVIGFGGVKKTGINKAVWEIPWCVVYPEFRGQGIGRSLTRQCREYAQEHGAKVLILSTPDWRIYENQGFHVFGSIPDGIWAPWLMWSDV